MNTTPSVEEIAQRIREDARMLLAEGRDDLLLKAISVPVLEELRILAAKSTLSPLHITADYRFFLTSYGNKEVILTPIHKALYLFFLAHPEGVEYKLLSDYRNEMIYYYKETANRNSYDKIEEAVDRLINPMDNAINEKVSRIKQAFSELMDQYQASYYVISGHTKKHVAGSSKIWYERLKLITLPRELVIFDVPLQSALLR